MGLFWRRPLCFFCFLFLGASLMATCLSLSVKWIAVISLAAVTILAVTLFFALGRKRYVLLSVALCLSSVALALTSSAVRIDSKRTAAEELIGEQSLQMSILEKD